MDEDEDPPAQENVVNPLSIRNPSTTNGCVMDLDMIRFIKSNDAKRAQRSLDATTTATKKLEKSSGKKIHDLKMFSSFCSLIATSPPSVLPNGRPSYSAMDTKDLIEISITYLKATAEDKIKTKSDACRFIANYLLCTVDAVAKIVGQDRLLL